MKTRIRPERLLSEEGYWPRPSAGVARFTRILTRSGTPVICSQGGVIPDLLARLAIADALPLEHISSKKGSTWLLSFTRENQRLVAADYIPAP